MKNSIYEYEVKTIKGESIKLDKYKGKVLLIVNVASKCGLTPQYKGLQELYTKFKGQNFEILGFPANNFMGQEPGTEEQIEQFCDLNYKVTFPLFSKISVKGNDKHPLYQYLTEGSEKPGEIKWNFHKFLIDKSGKVAANIDPTTEPTKLISDIEKLLS